MSVFWTLAWPTGRPTREVRGIDVSQERLHKSLVIRNIRIGVHFKILLDIFKKIATSRIRYKMPSHMLFMCIFPFIFS